VSTFIGRLPVRRHPSDTSILRGVAVTTLLFGGLGGLTATGVVPDSAGAAIVALATSILAGLGALLCRRAGSRTGGLEARVWRYFALGLTSWAVGCVPYLGFLATGGHPSDPAAWSQAGFLLAYPFWYRALWLLRQPVADESRAARIETWLIEASVFLMLGVVAVAALWNSALPGERNVALLIPVVMDLLLLASLYNAVRRTAITHRSAFVWFAYAFAVLAAIDTTVTFLVSRSPVIAGVATAGYAAAMGLLAVAARRPLRVTEARTVLGPSKTMLAALGLALCGPASALAPAAVRPVIWVVAALLFWRLWGLLRVHGESETDTLTGFLEPRAFSRQVAGVAQAASSPRPALLLAVDLQDFGRWNAQHGYGSGDDLLADVATRLDGSGLSGGAWSRIGPDRFAWIGTGYDASDGRRLAELVRGVAADNAGELEARAAFVVLPDDAATAANAIAAAEEGLAAAKSAGRRVVAFDHGRLDGIEYSEGYTASLAQRRAVIMEFLQHPESISTVFQPIVSLDDGVTSGFEALSRFHAEPPRTPDKWIAEAHEVGLGLEIEVECVRRAFQRRFELPEGAYLSVNMSPAAILAPQMEQALGEGSLEGLVIEITEHDAVNDYARLAARLADYRGRGALVAIDDTGAGHASMRHVTQLAPDYIKLDRSLVQDLHLDHAKRALVRSMVTLEKELGAAVVAEGIESLEELRALRELGVPLGQGYLLARPAPQPEPAPCEHLLVELAGPALGV
jgi:EAL domain-containing protein (putative c-di-GMP-specific phosphodiesterase class I)/GGDEF domain-containing protein